MRTRGVDPSRTTQRRHHHRQSVYVFKAVQAKHRQPTHAACMHACMRKFAEGSKAGRLGVVDLRSIKVSKSSCPPTIWLMTELVRMILYRGWFPSCIIVLAEEAVRSLINRRLNFVKRPFVVCFFARTTVRADHSSPDDSRMAHRRRSGPPHQIIYL